MEVESWMEQFQQQQPMDLDPYDNKSLPPQVMSNKKSQLTCVIHRKVDKLVHQSNPWKVTSHTFGPYSVEVYEKDRIRTLRKFLPSIQPRFPHVWSIPNDLNHYMDPHKGYHSIPQFIARKMLYDPTTRAKLDADARSTKVRNEPFTAPCFVHRNKTISEQLSDNFNAPIRKFKIKSKMDNTQNINKAKDKSHGRPSTVPFVKPSNIGES